MMHIVILLLVCLVACQLWMSCVCDLKVLLQNVTSQRVIFAAGVSVMGNVESPPRVTDARTDRQTVQTDRYTSFAYIRAYA